MDSRLMELASDLATYLLEQKYGEDLYNEDEEGTLTFKEPYQDRFNSLYDAIDDCVIELGAYLNGIDRTEKILFSWKKDT